MLPFEDIREILPGLIFGLGGNLVGVIAYVNECLSSYHKPKELYRILQLFPLIFNLVVRLLNRIVNHDPEIEAYLYTISIKFFKTHETSAKYEKVLTQGALRIERSLIALGVILFFLFQIHSVTSWVLSYIQDDFIYLLPIRLPYVDLATRSGFVINSMFIVFLSSVAYVAFLLVENTIVYNGLLAIPFVDVLVLNIEEIGDILKEPAQLENHGNENLQEKLEENFMEIIRKVQEYQDFQSNFIKSIEVSCFFIVTSNGIAIALAILTALASSTSIGIPSLFLFLFQVGNSCLAGTVIAHQNGRLLRALCEFPFYEMSREKQKIYLQFLHYCQNLNELKLPMIGICNFELFKDVIFASYSYFMYILNIVEF